ncbi:MAG: hypothetical protein F6J90_01850 [Moorea sp. SIOASIH]|uniref:hypothetical protein n=1 Tax=Moorena sp. SIOASIH TaxID=2607817 RepID=UPI0013B638B4|nr:hypothetical protein [Moorena sp. SIOASIH]NEO35112.1 hypothetical protein [Moorena sp. SIOASIH]
MGIIFDKGYSAVLGNQCGLGGNPQGRTSVVYPIRDCIAIPSSLWRDPLFPKIQDSVPHPIKNHYIAFIIAMRYRNFFAYYLLPAPCFLFPVS